MIFYMRDKLFKLKLRRRKRRYERYRREYLLNKAYEQYLPERKKRKVSNIMLVIIVIAIVGYVAVDFLLQYKIGTEISPTITTCWFVFWTSEVLALMGIKLSKVNKSNYDNTSGDTITNQPEDDESCG